MRILIIDVNFGDSSTGKIVADQYYYYNQIGNETAVCYGRGKKQNLANVYKFGIDWETRLHAFLTRVTGFTGCFSFFSTLRAIRFIKRFNPEVIHIHELHAYFLNIKQLLSFISRSDIDTVLTLHCEFNYTGKCGHSLECEKWKTICGKCPHLNEYPKSLFFDQTKTMFKQKKKAFNAIEDLIITTPSPWLSQRAKMSFFKIRDIFTIYNGIDTDIYYHRGETPIRNSYGINKEQKIILSVAPDIMSHSKGGDEVLKIAEELIGSDFLFVLIGSRETEVRRNNVLILNPIYDKNILAEFYSEAYCFLICSERETFSMTCAEAICCGTPVVGYKCGAPESIFEMPYAMFFEYGDFVSVKTAIISVQFPSRCQIERYGKDSFSKEKMCKNYLQLYNTFGSTT